MEAVYFQIHEAIAKKNQNAETIKTSLLDGWINRHGKSKIDGDVISKFCVVELGIEKLFFSPYHQEGDGQSERSMQAIRALIRCPTNDVSMLKYDTGQVF